MEHTRFTHRDSQIESAINYRDPPSTIAWRGLSGTQTLQTSIHRLRLDAVRLTGKVARLLRRSKIIQGDLRRDRSGRLEKSLPRVTAIAWQQKLFTVYIAYDQAHYWAIAFYSTQQSRGATSTSTRSSIPPSRPRPTLFLVRHPKECDPPFRRAHKVSKDSLHVIGVLPPLVRRLGTVEGCRRISNYCDCHSNTPAQSQEIS